jgi:hypothetical protein
VFANWLESCHNDASDDDHNEASHLKGKEKAPALQRQRFIPQKWLKWIAQEMAGGNGVKSSKRWIMGIPDPFSPNWRRWSRA